jgi:hypothetical protein
MVSLEKRDMAKITYDAVLNNMKAGSPDPVGMIGAMMNSAGSMGADSPHFATLAASFQK